MKASALVVLLGGCLATQPAEVVSKDPTPWAVKVALQHTLLMSEGCTAVHMGGGVVVTAHHCVAGSEPGTEFSVGVLTMHSELAPATADGDWALLLGTHPEVPYVCARNAGLGEHIYSVGWPSWRLDSEQRLVVVDGVAGTVEGFSVSYDEETEYTGMQRHSAPTYFGNSGGGLWADDGCLVGLVSGGFPSEEKYMTPAMAIGG